MNANSTRIAGALVRFKTCKSFLGLIPRLKSPVAFTSSAWVIVANSFPFAEPVQYNTSHPWAFGLVEELQ